MARLSICLAALADRHKEPHDPTGGHGLKFRHVRGEVVFRVLVRCLVQVANILKIVISCKATFLVKVRRNGDEL